MSVAINIKCTSPEEMTELRDKMHCGLVGSQAYVNSEIAICDLQDDAFTIIIGNSNDNDVDFDVHCKNLLER